MLRLFRRAGKTRATAARTGAFWSRSLGALFRRSALDDEFWDDLEETLVMADVGASTTMELLDAVRDRVAETSATEPAAVRELLRAELTARLENAAATAGQPESAGGVVLIVGVNGSGKTTTIAKLAHTAREQGMSVLMAAADTFRAGAIDQVKIWADRAGAEVVAHQPGSDPGAVAFDALRAARARGTDLVLIDTAGRLHTRHNLMEELRKVRGIVSREAGELQQQVLLVIDGTTGQNGLLQARAFTEAVSCDGVILTKLDGTAKGGIVFAIAGELGLPVWFIGTGESMDDIAAFEPAAFVDALLAEPDEEREE
ncbi:MAG: signal recognition particle-docking protein FtsY [Dehalococcoidia bacterium]